MNKIHRSSKAETDNPRAASHAIDVGSADYPMRAMSWPCARTVAGTIAVIHGMEEGWDVWEPLARLLDHRWRICALDLPWSGSRGHSWRFNRASPGDWIKRAFDALPFDVCAVVAHSFGAMALLDYYDAHGSDRHKASLLLSPFFQPREEPFDWPRLKRYSDRFPVFLQEALRIRERERFSDAEIRTAAASIVREKIGPAGSIEFLHLYSRTQGFRLARVEVPVLVVGGADDCFSTEKDCRDLARALAAAQVELLSDCGHFCMIERPHDLAALIDGFVLKALQSAPRRMEEMVNDD